MKLGRGGVGGVCVQERALNLTQIKEADLQQITVAKSLAI